MPDGKLQFRRQLEEQGVIDALGIIGYYTLGESLCATRIRSRCCWR